jgi:hypothetical protein
MNLFPMAFDVAVETLPAEFQMEITCLQCDTDLINIFRHAQLVGFYKLYLVADKFVILSDHAR